MLVSVLAPPAKADSCARTQLLLVFVHGFASNDVTFGDFPEHVRTVLSNSLVCDVDTVVYPTYSTTGSLTKAVDDFCEWLLNKTEERLNWNDGHACRECWTVILGHSMGGLVAADAIIKLKEATRRQHRILGLVAFDSPFYGVHPRVVSQTAASRASSVTEKYTTGLSLLSSVVALARTRASSAAAVRSAAPAGSSASKWGWATAGVGIAGALAGAYAGREHITRGVSFLTGHVEFASALIRVSELRNRVEIMRQDTELMFRTFYNEVRCKGPTAVSYETRTFIELPPSAAAEFFIKVQMDAEDEIDAHMNMFSPTFLEYPVLPWTNGAKAEPKANSAYYVLAQETIRTVVGMVERADARIVRQGSFCGAASDVIQSEICD